jgi:hypothetical protein
MATIKTIDITPSWRGLMPALVELAANAKDETARKIAWDELYRLADYADQVILTSPSK